MSGSAALLALLVAASGCSSDDNGNGDGDSERAGDGSASGGSSAGSTDTGGIGGSSSTDVGGGAATGGSGAAGPSDGEGEDPTAAAGAAGAGNDAPPLVPPPDPKPVEPGQLTVGAWDDNDNFDFFELYRERVQGQVQNGLLPLSLEEHQQANAAVAQARTPRTTLDVALVIDTTGSMGDELDYLQSELTDISLTVQERHPNAEQRWSLVVYRDQGDAYVTRSFDFTDDVEAFRSSLADQGHGGGGDYPEAPEAAFADAAQLSWRSGAGTARLLFWVADAPHHAERAQAMADGIRSVRDQDIHVYPVASSGVDELTELSMRAAAQITLGRYLFLTDDSGIGGAHKEPTIPCYWVTLLNQAIVRMVDLEMSGEYAPPAEQDIIRVGGAMNELGYCGHGSGQDVKPF